MDHPVVSSLLPVVLLIVVGFVAGKMKLIRQEAVRDLTNLVFLVLTQALLFRTMCNVRVQELDFAPVSLYFAVAAGLFIAMLLVQGASSRAAVIALSGTFSNTVMIGIPLVGLAYGQQALVLLFTLISLHALVLLTFATVVLELLSAREHSAASAGPTRHPLQSVWLAVRNAVVHPVPMPIMAGLLYAQTGWGLPDVVDRPLQLLGNSFGPVALVLVGVTLANASIGANLRGALVISAVKTLLHPALMALVGYAAGLRGLSLTVLVVAASLPIGANVFLFSQRYQKAEDLVTASVAVSTLVALVSVTLAMSLMALLSGSV
ncbi:AEC family transporter [Curvibacter sp. CHRR-16]|uniref:AEC family transporter n=1 Tax=Curvibacter sp. CHRR-16 TaxID=2835872 RepID=UPI001BD9AD83|nr:AEC family transporter [Curvibacter sp. CHRR-16]MBT0571316.1 AEC family transporter [Curvibacter sp. CHRR-16]